MLSDQSRSCSGTAASFRSSADRNAINDGLPIVECPELVSAVEEGDEIRIDLEGGKIVHREKEYVFPPMAESVRKILELGGLAEYLKLQLQENAGRLS
jgi:3-isopropylmalate/(R)-2-methylmalate dehydratase small subunit